MEKVITPFKNGDKIESYNGWELFNEDWFISPNGDMYASYGRYDITADRLMEDDWIIHLMEKAWFDANTFLPAYFQACYRAKIKAVKILTHY